MPKKRLFLNWDVTHEGSGRSGHSALEGGARCWRPLWSPGAGRPCSWNQLEPLTCGHAESKGRVRPMPLEEPPSHPSPLPHLYADLRPQIHFLCFTTWSNDLSIWDESADAPPPPNCFVTTNCWPSGPERSLLKVPYQSSARGLEPHLGHAGTVPSRWGPGSCSELWVQGYCTNASALASLTLWKHVVLLTQLSDSLRSNNVPNVYKYE